MSQRKITFNCPAGVEDVRDYFSSRMTDQVGSPSAIEEKPLWGTLVKDRFEFRLRQAPGETGDGPVKGRIAPIEKGTEISASIPLRKWTILAYAVGILAIATNIFGMVTEPVTRLDVSQFLNILLVIAIGGLSEERRVTDLRHRLERLFSDGLRAKPKDE